MTFHLPFTRNKSDSNAIARRDYFNNILHDILNEFHALPSSFAPDGTKSLVPRTDVTETESEYCLEVELPGMNVNNIELKIDNNILTIKGHKEETSESKEKHYHMRERYYGTFQRSITLPSNIQEENIDARFKDGILYVKIPKREQGQSKRISVKF